MRINLKGIHKSPKRLADGRVKIYYYAWKSGPPLVGEPGSPEFTASYNEAVARKATAPSGKLASVLQDFQASTAFTGLRARTQFDYVRQIKIIEADFADFPLAAMSDRRTRGIFLKWRDKLAAGSKRQADYAWSVLKLILAWALDRGDVSANPCRGGGRVYSGTRVDKIWSADDEAAFLRSAPAHLHLPLLLALWTGQRQGDLLALPWSAYDGTHIRLRQSKTGRAVTIPVGAPLKVALDAATGDGPLINWRTRPILTNTLARPWNSHAFQVAWANATRQAGIIGRTFHDLRGTAVTRLAVAGCTEAQIASITGHSLRDVCSILDSNYLHRDPALSESAIRKLETSKQAIAPN
jgi:integrase